MMGLYNFDVDTVSKCLGRRLDQIKGQIDPGAKVGRLANWQVEGCLSQLCYLSVRKTRRPDHQGQPMLRTQRRMM